ncbi:uncharacterized protein LOC124933994 [Impatiens glandulifera]|uniref:uncharacterized protein LOC124933994 n=1 Tax=Impatiens glandulifera TaxID=253017 RepID=UPI001FB0D0E2|nr:uncharacterized protein LOC124933994 [Impatiens glandulifera]
MAGGSNHQPKGQSDKPPSSSSSSHRKSRGESSKYNPSSSKQTQDSRPHKPSSNPREKELAPSILGPSPAQAHTKAPMEHERIRSHHPGALIPFPPEAPAPPPMPAYGFHMLERRSIFLADGSVRSYLALPPDYRDFDPPRSLPFLHQGKEMLPPGMGMDKRFLPLGPMSPEFGRHGDSSLMRERNQDYWNSLGLDGRMSGAPMPMENMLKRRYGDERESKDGHDLFARQRQQLLQYGNAGAGAGRDGYPPPPIGGRADFMAGTSNNPYQRELPDFGVGGELRASKYMRVSTGSSETVGLRHNDVDQEALKKAFLHFLKSINENAGLKKNYLENGKQGPIQCVVCGRSSKDFQDVHNLVMHAYNSDKPDLLIDHLGLHKAICVLMGWGYSKVPDNFKLYQLISAEDAAANQDDMILWPPVVIIMNTSTGKSKDGRSEGLGNRAMDMKIRDLGFGTGKSRTLYGKDGHMGVTLIKFPSDKSGLTEAIRLSEHFERENHGRRGWTRVQSSISNRDDETKNPNLVKLDVKTGERGRVLYGFVGTVFDLEKLDFETRKKVGIESKKEYLSSSNRGRA